MSGAQLDFTIPTLVTERLILRPHRLDDFEASAALWADPGVVRFISGVPFNQEQSWSRFLRYKGSWHFLGFGFWAVEERQSGDFVGEVGFLEGRRAMTPSIQGTLETGWVLHPSVHGKGYATEALMPVIAWGKARFPDQRMTCIIATENNASLRVAAKLGFEEVTRTVYNDSAVVLLERNGDG